jgi:hypothetical protein
MPTLPSRLPLAAAFAGTLALSVPARAADEDTQLWVYSSIAVPVAKNATATFELSPRFRQGGNQVLTRATVDFKLTPAVSLGGGAAYVDNHGGADEFRSHQQLTVTLGALAFRSRAEERFFAGADRTQLRLRQRIQLSEPVAHDTRLSLAGELLYIARTENRATDPRVDSWRGTASLQHRFSSHVDGTLGYLLIYSPRAGKPDKLSHVPQISLSARL